MTQSPITRHASTSLNHVPRDRLSSDQHIELVNIIGEPTKGMLIRSMAAKLIVSSASECLFADFPFEIEPKKVSKDEKGISIFKEKHTRDLLKKYEISDISSFKTPMVPPNNLGHDLSSKPVNETLYRGMLSY
ncbi:hypothetical protein Tco_1380684 [Tanacetum coccineum]